MPPELGGIFILLDFRRISGFYFNLKATGSVR